MVSLFYAMRRDKIESNWSCDGVMVRCDRARSEQKFQIFCSDRARSHLKKIAIIGTITRSECRTETENVRRMVRWCDGVIPSSVWTGPYAFRPHSFFLKATAGLDNRLVCRKGANRMDSPLFGVQQRANRVGTDRLPSTI